MIQYRQAFALLHFGLGRPGAGPSSCIVREVGRGTRVLTLPA
jgi:hypothetical protein